MTKIFTFLMLGGLLFVLLTSIAELPTFGESYAPAHNEISNHYIEQGPEDTNSPNLIGAIITDYRAFDTLGEATVLFTAIAAVVAILGVVHHKQDKGDNHE